MADSSNSTIAPKIDRAALMRAAWATYRLTFTRPGRKTPFSRSNFAWCLQCAWQKHHEARMSEREKRIARIEHEIDMLKYKSFRYDTVAMQRRLETELASLAA